MKNVFLMALVVTGAFATISACKSDDEDGHSHGSSSPVCAAIIEACHPVDKGEGRISECHTTAHEATSDATCTPIKDECIRVCEGAASDAGGQ